jgi:FKBP-type peptidyl-prolyl cis-trans isomerase (trigger factor)
MGQGRMIPGFEEGLFGHKAGEEFTLSTLTSQKITTLKT